jgi:hypothetical protein
MENDVLRTKLRQAQNRIADLEKLLKERMAHEHQLRDSIMQVRNMVERLIRSLNFTRHNEQSALHKCSSPSPSSRDWTTANCPVLPRLESRHLIHYNGTDQLPIASPRHRQRRIILLSNHGFLNSKKDCDYCRYRTLLRLVPRAASSGHLTQIPLESCHSQIQGTVG